MKRTKSLESLPSLRRRRRNRLLLAVAAAAYLLLISLKLPHLLFGGGGGGAPFSAVRPHAVVADALHGRLEEPRVAAADALHRRLEEPRVAAADAGRRTLPLPRAEGYGRITGEMLRRYAASGRSLRPWSQSGNFSEFERLANEAWALGGKAWADAASYQGDLDTAASSAGDCPAAVSVAGGGEVGPGGEKVTFLPCGLAVGAAVTVVATPRPARAEFVPQLARNGMGNGTVLVSQFMVELRGLRAVDGEDPPRILHLNPRLRGDWSKRPVIELNTCFRMQWGKAMRCDGSPSPDAEDTVDGFKKCEKWEESDAAGSKESKTTSWLNRFIGRAKKPEMKWPYPFVEGRMFVLTLQAGVEGYHIYVGGRHVISFPYRMGFTLEDATGLAIKGDVDVHSVYATSLPRSNPSFSLQQVLEMSEKWKARPVPEEPIQLFIGILSATNHFAERMAIRKTWMQYPAIQLGNAVARFFVALSPRKEVNAALNKEAEYFRDIIIVPFMDRYELVVLKTVAICQYGVQNVTAEYIMKCDDDTFIRVDVVLRQIYGTKRNMSLYMGNLNLFHRPLRSGKWAVTYEEWPERVYPPYANGPGYIISSDIGKDIVSRNANHTLRLFKMEDVSMGMWVEDFNASAPVLYLHNWKFCQYGCMENYFTAHYQSPRQMICLWDKLSGGRAECCNFR